MSHGPGSLRFGVSRLALAQVQAGAAHQGLAGPEGQKPTASAALLPEESRNGSASKGGTKSVVPTPKTVAL